MAREDQAQRQSRASRCAIYTRKSTEEGLDQEFNSLDAQREACAAYVLSQRHEGWSLLPEFYDDGGYSGGTMNRPGLQRLLADVQAGKVDVIVVYKVDRLTRALSDFSKIVDILDATGASFVSITQSFNTTTSMGRLTLNVLLSFAQFEREVIGERVRDKVAASKRKGMWMGGTVPLGYDVIDRKLVINETEAETVCHIFQRYLELGSVRELMTALSIEGARTKIQTMRDGSKRGGVPFARGPLYCLLKNPVYAGQVRHHRSIYPGQHEALLPQDVWDRVQAQLARNGAARRLGTNAAQPSLLAGRLRDADDRAMVASHASKGARRYRYYISAPDSAGGGRGPVRLPAGELEALVRRGIASLLGDTGKLTCDLEASGHGGHAREVLTRWGATAGQVATMTVARLRQLMSDLDIRLVIKGASLAATYEPAGLLRAGDDAASLRCARFPFDVPGTLVRRGHEDRIIVVPDAGDWRRPNARLVSLLVRSFAARRALVHEAPPEDRSAANARKSELSRIARMSYLAPDITQAIVEGTQPAGLGARELLRTGELPFSWAEQRRLFRFPEIQSY
jgi:site-specific DNA recombinase